MKSANLIEEQYRDGHFAVAGDGGAGDGQCYPEIQFDDGVDNRVNAEDPLSAVRIFGVSLHAMGFIE